MIRAESSAPRSRYASRDGSFPVGRAGRHVHAPLQHRPHGRDAGRLPRRPARSTAARRSTRVVVGIFARDVLPGRARPVARLRDPVGPDRPPPGDALRPGLRRGRGDPHRRSRRTCSSSAARAGSRAPRPRRASRRSSASSRSPPPATSCSAARPRPLRGRDAARARRPGSSSRRSLFAAIGPAAFFLNALVYGVSFLIYWRGVEDPAGEAQTLAETARTACSRYVELLRSSHVWLLAPTWIAVNASIGLWFSQSIFQLDGREPRASRTSC